MWQTTRWLQNCEINLDDEEISWWPLVSPLTDGSDATTKDLPRRLMAAWKWAGAASESPICLPVPTILNIRQFLDEDLTGHGWSQQQWLLAWDELVCPPISAVPCTLHWSEHLGYIQGRVVELGPVLPSMQFYISQPDNLFA